MSRTCMLDYRRTNDSVVTMTSLGAPSAEHRAPSFVYLRRYEISNSLQIFNSKYLFRKNIRKNIPSFNMLRNFKQRTRYELFVR